MAPTRAVLAVLVFALAATALAAAPCAPSDASLCLAASRFQVSVAWTDLQGHTGSGHAVPLTSDTGYFWFFTDSNVELIVKVLDATAINGKFWVFFGALSNVEYTLTVRDSATGSTKTYQNPSGQFASVGDTAAFAGSAIAQPSHEAVMVRGTPEPPSSIADVQQFIGASISDASRKAAADFTACPGAATDLLLDGCRFQIEVSWQDSQGRTGDGQAVQLTDDTGYFWFFSDSNVELVVKVLDARSINGNFWVFFGALSNIQYTVTVLDLQTGAVRQYTNPAGTFASMGDTQAFAAGLSVSAVKDDTKAVSAEIGVSGGTLQATGADGTVFTLTIPENALFFETNVTMTPLDHIDGFPFSGGLRGGVQLEPEGLVLLQTATLTIQPSTPIPPAELAPFSYRGSGDDFLLYLARSDPSGLQLPVSHFSGYGLGSGTPGDDASVESSAASGPFAPYIERAADVSRRERTGELSDDAAAEQIRDIFTDAWLQVVLPALVGLQSCNRQQLDATMQLMSEYFGGAKWFISDSVYGQRQSDALVEVKRIVIACIDAAFDLCVSQHDTGQVRTMSSLLRFLQLQGLVDDNEYADVFGKIERCLRFEVDFDSSITVDNDALTFHQQVYAAIPVRLDASQNEFFLSGHGPNHFLFATVTNKTPAPCVVTAVTRDGTFDVMHLSPGGPEREAYDVLMLYDPGQPAENDIEDCAGLGSNQTGFQSLWASEFTEFHQDEVRVSNPVNYIAYHWDNILQGDIMARKAYSRSTVIGGELFTESTVIKLKHTPDAPAP